MSLMLNCGAKQHAYIYPFTHSLRSQRDIDAKNVLVSVTPHARIHIIVYAAIRLK